MLDESVVCKGERDVGRTPSMRSKRTKASKPWSLVTFNHWSIAYKTIVTETAKVQEIICP